MLLREQTHIDMIDVSMKMMYEENHIDKQHRTETSLTPRYIDIDSLLTMHR